jgi:hypothetical protein
MQGVCQGNKTLSGYDGTLKNGRDTTGPENYRAVDMSLMPGYWFLVAGPANEKMDFAEGEKTPLPLLSFLSLLDLLYISFFCYLAFDCVLNDFSRVSGLYFFSFFFSELVSEFVFFDLRILGVHI